MEDHKVPTPTTSAGYEYVTHLILLIRNQFYPPGLRGTGGAKDEFLDYLPSPMVRFLPFLNHHLDLRCAGWFNLFTILTNEHLPSPCVIPLAIEFTNI